MTSERGLVVLSTTCLVYIGLTIKLDLQFEQCFDCTHKYLSLRMTCKRNRQAPENDRGKRGGCTLHYLPSV